MKHIWNTWNTFGRYGTRLGHMEHMEHMGKTLLGEHLWETTESAKAFFVNICCLGNWALGLGEPVPQMRGNRFPRPGRRLQPISILDCKNPKGKPGWGKT